MDISGSPWKLYVSDPPTPVGFTRPGDDNVPGPVGIRRIVWTNNEDERITPGAVAYIRDAQNRDVFRRVWPDDGGVTNQIEQEINMVYDGLFLEVLEEGTLELYID